MKIPTLLGAVLILSSSHVGEAAPKPTCDQIDAAISATEEFVETSLAGETKAADEALAAMRETLNTVRPSLQAEAVAEIEVRISAAEAAAKAGDASAAAVAAMETYRHLAAAFEMHLPTTLAVAMLDYSGFRLQGLAAAATPDWAAIAATVSEAGGNWEATSKLMKDKGLIDLGTSTQAGLEAAAAARQVPWLVSLAQIQLDSVDLLEREVKNRAKGACK